MTTAHTATMPPGPWIKEGLSLKSIDHGKKYTVCKVGNPKFTPESNEAAAEFIYRACNEYQPMLDLLAKAGIRCGELAKQRDDLVKALRSAVKTAGGMYLMSASEYEAALAGAA